MSYFDTGERIRELRKERGLNQDQLAELASLNRVTVAKYESGRVEPGAQALSRIADALEISADVLLGRADPPEESARAPRTVESRFISEVVDQLPPAERERAMNMFRAVYAEAFKQVEEKMA